MVLDFAEMPKHMTRPESVSDSTEGLVGVAAADIDTMVNTACQKAIDVLKTELMKMFSDITSCLVSVEQRLVTLELKATDYDSALNNLSNRVMGLQSTLDDASTVVGDAPDRDRVEAYVKEIESVKAEARSAICAANDIEQYGRRNNIRIRGLAVDNDCRATVVSFIKDKLQMNINSEDIESAHVLPSRSEYSENINPSQASAAHSSPSGTQHGPPVVIVRFQKRDVRDSVLRNRRLLKRSRYAIVEDLTALNSKTLTRVSKDQNVAAAWTWNGKVYVMTKSGEKLTVKPFQPIYS